MADPRINDIDIFEDDRDYLDRSVDSFNENVPLAAQIGLGISPAGPAIDIAEITKYGRDAVKDFGDTSRQDIKTGLTSILGKLYGRSPYTETPDKLSLAQ